MKISHLQCDIITVIVVFEGVVAMAMAKGAINIQRMDFFVDHFFSLLFVVDVVAFSYFYYFFVRNNSEY